MVAAEDSQLTLISLITQQLETRAIWSVFKGFIIMDAKLLQILVCPVTKGPLIYDKKNNELISKSARLAYPIRDGIPVMLEDEARKLTESEYSRSEKAE